MSAVLTWFLSSSLLSSFFFSYFLKILKRDDMLQLLQSDRRRVVTVGGSCDWKWHQWGQFGNMSQWREQGKGWGGIIIQQQFMRGNHEITPWQTNDEEPYPRLLSLKQVSKSQRRSLVIPSHTLISPKQPLKPYSFPESIPHTIGLDKPLRQDRDPKDPISSFRSKRLSVFEHLQRGVSSENVLVIPSLKSASVQLDQVLNMYKEFSSRVGSVDLREQLDREELRESLEKEGVEVTGHKERFVLPLNLVPEMKRLRKGEAKNKSKSLSSLHAHLKYFSSRNKQKQNIKLEPIKFDSLEEILKRLPRRETKVQDPKNIPLTPVVAYQTIKVLEPFPKLHSLPKPPTRIRGEQYMDRLLERMP